MPPETIGIALEVFRDAAVAAAGGPATTRSSAGFVERLIGDILESAFGAGTTLGRNVPLGTKARPSSGEDLHLCNFMIRRAAFERCGGLKHGAYPGEDPELIRRLLRDGLKLVYEPRMLVRRPRRTTVPAFSRQMFRYGAARAMHAFTAASAPDAVFALPSLFVLYLAALVSGLGLQAGALRALPLVCYGVFLAACAVDSIVRRVPLSRALGAIALYPVLHVSYGAGFLVGACSRLRFPARRLSAKPA